MVSWMLRMTARAIACANVATVELISQVEYRIDTREPQSAITDERGGPKCSQESGRYCHAQGLMMLCAAFA